MGTVALPQNMIPVIQISHLLILISVLSTSHVWTSTQQPNIILFISDDFGYGDLSVFGHPTQEWGPIDQMALEGMRFTQFYSVSVFCTPSRASILTGRYPMRSGMDGSLLVHLPCHNKGLPHSEITIPEALRDVGYSTGIVGKWHLGTNAYSHNDGSYLPHTHGFDYVGHILTDTLFWDCDTWKRHRKKPKCTKCYLYHNTTIVQQPIDVDTLTTTLLHDAKAFVHNNTDRPFFLIYSFPQTHTPMFNMNEFKGKSKRGIYGDQVNEMAWAVGEVLQLVRELGLDENTLSVFTSDHGPHREMCEESGSAGMFKGGKGNMWEGGVRVPTIARWPGTIPSGVTSTSFLSLMDLFSTFIDIGGGKVPDDRPIDSLSFAKLLKNKEGIPSHSQRTNNGFKKSNQYYNQPIRNNLYFYCMDRTFTAIRYNQFKIHFRYTDPNLQLALLYNCNGSVPISDYYHQMCSSSVVAKPPIIYNVEEDPGEDFPLNYEDHEDMVERVVEMIKEQNREFANLPKPSFTRGHCSRKYIPCCNPPYCVCNNKRY